MLDALFQTGCDDALVGVGKAGGVALEFVREAPDADVAVRSALADVRNALGDATLVEAAPDRVGLTDVAELVGVSRQNMRKLMLAHQDTFPSPIHAGTTAIWHFADVLRWLATNAGYDVDPALHEIAEVMLRVNLAQDAQRVPRRAIQAVAAWLRA